MHTLELRGGVRGERLEVSEELIQGWEGPGGGVLVGTVPDVGVDAEFLGFVSGVPQWRRDKRDERDEG